MGAANSEQVEESIERLTVFYTHARNFWSHTTVSVASVLKHTSHVDFHIFTDAVDPYWLRKMELLCPPASSTVTHHLFDSAQTDGLKNCGYFGLTTYNRLFIPELFAGRTNHLIYLDSDMVVRASLRELAAIPLNGHVLAAVPGVSKSANHAKSLSLGHGQQAPYFNAGLMVIDPDQWVKEGIRDRCIAFGMEHPERIQLADQDMLNYVLAGRYQRLPLKWNVVTEYFSAVDGEDMDSLDGDELEKLRLNPAIVHFNGQFKPWHLTYKHPYKKDYTSLRQELHRRPYISDDFPSLLFTKPIAYLRRQVSR